MTTTHQHAVQKKPILVYFLAAPQDQDACDAIHKHLSGIVRYSDIPIEINTDFEIPAGKDKEEFKQKLYEADIVLSFISADYISDDDTYERNQKVILRHNNGDTIILPILVRNCLWKSTPFVDLQLLPRNFQPLNNKQFWNSEDDALTAVVAEIHDAINAFDYKDEAALPPVIAEEKTLIKPQTDQVEPTPGLETASVPQPQTTSEIAAVVPTPEIPKKQIKSVKTIQVDWRKGYFKRVLWKRAVAFFLDNLLTGVPALAIGFATALVASMAIYGTETEVSDSEMVLVLLIFFGVYIIICAAMESSKWRGTFGKRIMKLQITDRDGHAISFFRALWRNIARLIVGYLEIILFPIQIYTFWKTKKLWHDQASKTVIGERLTK